MNHRTRAPFLRMLAGLLVGLSLVSCAAQPAAQAAPAPSATAELSLQEKAAAQATEMIAQAEATAMILQAKAEATALVERAAHTPTSDWPGVIATQPPPGEGGENQEAEEDPNELGHMVKTQVVENVEAFTDPEAYTVELINVGFAGEGGFIIVNFYASKKAVDDFWQGRLSITDEASGTVYNEVATMPLIGPLIGRPREPGQPGYVMLVNTPPGLPPGSLVTVQLGQFTQEHVQVIQ